MSETTKLAICIGWPIVGVLGTLFYRLRRGYEVSLLDLVVGAMMAPFVVVFLVCDALHNIKIGR